MSEKGEKGVLKTFALDKTSPFRQRRPNEDEMFG